MFDDVLPAMEWRELDAGPFALRSELVARLEANYSLLQAERPPGVEDLLWGALEALPAARRQRVLRSPWVSAGLLRQSHPVLDPRGAARAIHAELFADPGAGNRIGTITVDHEGDIPVPRRQPPQLFTALTGAERTTAVANVTGALAALAALAPAVHRLILTFLELLVLRTVPESPSVRSSSHPTNIGLVLLKNAHLPAASPALLIECLVHETIHSILYSYENLRKSFTRRNSELVLASPWTGVTLSLPNYVHAVFVWYGLFHLWALAGRAGIPQLRGAEVAGAQERAALGFTRQPVSRGLRPFFDRIRPQILPVLQEMEGRMEARLAG